ncbi:E3 ubiquitin-protein ligase MIB2-like isoform X3 [Orbicella faveolata]|uniref:E3 ubiquitin-protein ligase MIB2-like isoform X3 n=1 Tax=Orbicella faveolata TaxID=48498 RepID=UPI0009E2E80B|nr:E3 ubiquitin-protein ligase MIB2-like isoform X3 [Orbicella faveolata]
MEILGTRVVRGRDWEWGNQDGGEGCVGTVVEIGEDKKSPFTPQLVWIQWDCGTKANYRAGFDGKHDLRVFETGNQGVRHVYVCCDGCNQDPVVGLRWRCLNCANYDLCTTCYMTDIHDTTHRFERIDKSRAKGVPVGTRQGSLKLEARGMFKGAKVVRGPDWEWKESDRGSEMEGEVTEITGWSDDTLNDAVRVAWKSGPKGNIYRLGTDGKVDVKCTVPAVGGCYYRDHLPPLIVQLKKSQSGFTTGDNVCVQQVTTEKLQELSIGHGGWNADMEKFIGKVGVVRDFTANGDVVVEYPDRRWRYNPAALTKIQQFKRGDEVVVRSDKKLVKELQEGHGGWNEAMISTSHLQILGRTGKVLEVDGNGDILTLVEGDKWMLSPSAVTYVTEPEPSQSMNSSDESNEDPLGFFRFFRDVLLRHASEQGSLSLVHAAKTNQLSRVREILDAQPEVIDEIEGGHSALHLACHEGHCDIIRELLDRGANRTALDSEGYTAMHHATYGDQSGEALKLLLEKGFDPNVQHSSNRRTPLHLAVKRDNEMADEAGDTPLHDAISGQKHSMVDMLLDNPRLSLTVCNRGGFNYLHCAVLKGNKRAVEKLLAKAGDVLNVRKSDRFTTLHIAAINDHREIAKILLEQPGCDVNALGADNQSALHIATDEGYPVMVEILLDHGADVNAVDKDGDTALHIALAKESLLKTESMSQMPGLELLLRVHGHSRSYAPISRSLLSYGADVFKMNGTGETPLHRCQGSHVEHLIREIAASGGTSQIRKVPNFGATNQSSNRQEVSSSSSATKAEGTQTDVESNRPKTSEANHRQEDVNEHSDITVQDQPVRATDEQENQEEEDTPLNEDDNIVENSNLVKAAETNQLSRVRDILDAQPEVIDEIEGGHSALHLACHEGHCDIIRELLDRGANRTVLDSQGYTAMHHSTYADRSGEAVKLLLEKGLDPNVQHSSNRSTPLHLAVKRNNEMAVRILTQCSECNVNLQVCFGNMTTEFY